MYVCYVLQDQIDFREDELPRARAAFHKYGSQRVRSMMHYCRQQAMKVADADSLMACIDGKGRPTCLYNSEKAGISETIATCIVEVSGTTSFRSHVPMVGSPEPPSRAPHALSVPPPAPTASTPSDSLASRASRSFWPCLKPLWPRPPHRQPIPHTSATFCSRSSLEKST